MGLPGMKTATACSTTWKKLSSKTGVLKFFDWTKQTVVECDASSLSLGAVSLQEGKSVMFASRALLSAERNYSQLEKEMLATVYGLRRFDQYVYGQPVIVESDYKPLEMI